jgi:hypothetical protein
MIRPEIRDRIVIAHHRVLMEYGHWLANDLGVTGRSLFDDSIPF